ncbi:MAG TPA: sigma factor, partial [Saprospiraceae bacterium]|nr:sigma factor [Saprospiraceae bacterium]
MINSIASAEKSNTITRLSESELIQSILNGESSQFETIIRNHNPSLHKIGRSYGFNHEDTQDLMQETFVSAYLNLSKFENRSSLKTWLIKIMIRNCFRKKQKS